VRLTAGTAGEVWEAVQEQRRAVCMQPSTAATTADSLSRHYQSQSMKSPDSPALSVPAPCNPADFSHFHC